MRVKQSKSMVPKCYGQTALIPRQAATSPAPNLKTARHMTTKRRFARHPHDAAQALPLEHEVERHVDLGEGHAVRDELFQLQLLPHVHLDDFPVVGVWFVVAEGALQGPFIDEVHRVEHRLLVRDTHQHRHAPPIMDTFEGGDHGVDVASALNHTVNSAIGHLDKHLLHGLGVVLWVHKVGASKFLSLFVFCRVQIHTNDP